ncbi:hypothetical protein [Streptomyces buecherae]|uniref:hypothetical protein n=1 Tax=Streptomyces buecherae TaxID=2763006 RepID=UPI001C25A101|nr:hypothetical protein [Streptomyces buecherae]
MRARRLTRRTGSGTGAGPASRRGRTTIAALAVAGLAACTALTGCGSDDGSDDKTDKAGGGKSSESPETPGAGADQSQVVQTAYEKTAEAETAKMRLVTKTSAGSKDVTVRGEGVIDFDDGASKLRLSGDGKQLDPRTGMPLTQPPTATTHPGVRPRAHEAPLHSMGSALPPLLHPVLLVAARSPGGQPEGRERQTAPAPTQMDVPSHPASQATPLTGAGADLGGSPR